MWGTSGTGIATAFAISGSAPPNGYIAEYEFFIGPAAVAPYETPGTQALAETVLPFLRDQNTILLANHGSGVLVRHGDARRAAGGDSGHLQPEVDHRAKGRD
jgi:hypothetical protein